MNNTTELKDKALMPMGDKVQVVRTQIEWSKMIPEIPDYNYRDLDRIIQSYSEDRAVCLIGESGTGKTVAVKRYAQDKGLPFIRVACEEASIMREFLGKREIVSGTTLYRTGVLTEAFQVPSVILFDEFNSLPSSKLFFLHELLDNRQFFLKEGDMVIKLNPECKIFLACNPNNGLYTGTNKTNVALSDRLSVIVVEEFNSNQLAKIFDTGDRDLSEALKRYYEDVRRVIKDQKLRLVFSIRTVKGIVRAIKRGAPLIEALTICFWNKTSLTASDKEKQILISIAKVCFGDKLKLGVK